MRGARPQRSNLSQSPRLRHRARHGATARRLLLKFPQRGGGRDGKEGCRVQGRDWTAVGPTQTGALVKYGVWLLQASRGLTPSDS